MTPLLFLVVALAGGLGATLRLVLDGLVQARVHTTLPLGTLLINVVGSFVLGWLTGGLFARGASSVLKAALGPGLLGSFTTFSAVILALVLLTVSTPPQVVLAVVYLVVTLLLGLGASFLGIRLGERSRKRVAE